MDEAEKKSYWFQDFIRNKVQSVKHELFENLEKGKDSQTTSENY